jgi:hypothetical protein
LLDETFGPVFLSEKKMFIENNLKKGHIIEKSLDPLLHSDLKYNKTLGLMNKFQPKYTVVVGSDFPHSSAKCSQKIYNRRGNVT